MKKNPRSFLLNDETLKDEYAQLYLKYLPELQGEVVSDKAISKENGKIHALQSSIFTIPVPSITYNIKF